MTLKEESRVTTVISSSKYQDFDIRFSFTETEGVDKPGNISASGNKLVDGKNANFNASLSDNGSNITYSNMQPNSSLADAVFVELNKILNKTSV